jgi:hypothetical protein
MTFEPRLGDYITNGYDLLQVVGCTAMDWVVEDCSWPCDQPVPLIMMSKRQPEDASWRRVEVCAVV